MKEIKGDLWTLPTDVICITTNGFVKPNGRAVMGRGCALEAKQKYPSIDRWLGGNIKAYGNHVSYLGHYDERYIYSFPVKHNWWEKADLELIKRSCRELMDSVTFTREVLLPRPGCGNGHLNWEEVKPVISKLLGDNVWVVSK